MTSTLNLPPDLPMVQPAPRAAGRWTATTTHGIDTVRLTVHGVLQEPTPGFKPTLTRLTAAGGDPATLLLRLTVAPPTGIEPDHITPTQAEYTQTFVIPKDHVPTRVVILADEATVTVMPAH